MAFYNEFQSLRNKERTQGYTAVKEATILEEPSSPHASERSQGINLSTGPRLEYRFAI